MAFTGKKIKGSKVLTPETVENRKQFYKLLNEIEELDSDKSKRLQSSMFEQMFNHLSHSAQVEMLEWVKRENWNAFMTIKLNENERNYRLVIGDDNQLFITDSPLQSSLDKTITDNLTYIEARNILKLLVKREN